MNNTIINDFTVVFINKKSFHYDNLVPFFLFSFKKPTDDNNMKILHLEIYIIRNIYFSTIKVVTK